MDSITYIGCSSLITYSSFQKNSAIAGCSTDLICFYDRDQINEKTIAASIERLSAKTPECPPTVVVFADIPEGPAGSDVLLSRPDMNISAIVFCKECPADTGCYNELLKYASDYELLLRLSMYFDVLCVRNDSPSDRLPMDFLSEAVISYAYITSMYWSVISSMQFEDAVLNCFVKMFGADAFNVFSETLLKFIRNPSLRLPFQRNTSPILILDSGAECQNTLRLFQEYFGNSLKKHGQPVIYMSDMSADEINSLVTCPQTWKAIIGFQDRFFRNDLESLHTFSFNFWFDNPLFFKENFENIRDCNFLCIDNNYRYFISARYGKCAYFFPPAGTPYNGLPISECRYDVSFVGTYADISIIKKFNETQSGFFEFMISNPELTFSSGICRYFRINEGDPTFWECLDAVSDVCRIVPGYFRHLVIEALISSGITVHVFGDSWRKMDTGYPENLIIHESVDASEVMNVYASSKISLNVMTWHKASLTERIINIMLAGAVCVSDETDYLNEYYENDKDMVIFRLKDIEALPARIKYLLEHEDVRQSIAKSGQEKTLIAHTWDIRAGQLLDLIRGMEGVH